MLLAYLTLASLMAAAPALPFRAVARIARSGRSQPRNWNLRIQLPANLPAVANRVRVGFVASARRLIAKHKKAPLAVAASAAASGSSIYAAAAK
jgi:hypothetical protein